MPELSRQRRLLVLGICCMSLLIVGLDNTIVNVALPSIGRDLHASVSGLQWTIDAYALVLASLLMLSGSTADRIGRRRTFQAGLILFMVGSLLCSLAPGLGWLIAFRMIQAVGGSMLNPVAMSIIANISPTRPNGPERSVSGRRLRPQCGARPGGGRRAGRFCRLARDLLGQHSGRHRGDRAHGVSCPSPGPPGTAGPTRWGRSWPSSCWPR